MGLVNPSPGLSIHLVCPAQCVKVSFGITSPYWKESMQSRSILESVLRRDRMVVAAGLAVIAALAWAYLVYLALGVEEMAAGMAMAQMGSWTATDFVLMFLMWSVMMMGMMTPTAAPMILIFATINRQRRDSQAPYVPTGLFLSSYLLVWTAFAAAATIGNWGLHANGLLTSMMGASASRYVGGGLLVVAGLFQLSPLKSVCLNHCRSPVSFIVNDWREGHWGTFVMGLRHGAYCLGCCWALMGLLFVLGMMNLLWIAALAAFVLLEKAAPGGRVISWASGILLLAWGGLMTAGVLG